MKLLAVILYLVVIREDMYVIISMIRNTSDVLLESIKFQLNPLFFSLTSSPLRRICRKGIVNMNMGRILKHKALLFGFFLCLMTKTVH